MEDTIITGKIVRQNVQESDDHGTITIYTVQCPNCGDWVEVQPFNAPKCFCGIEWSVELTACGTR